MSFLGIGWANAFGPLLGLAVLALALPFITVSRATRSQRRLAGGMLATAGLTFAAGAALFTLLYARAGNAMGLNVLRPALLSALVWGPLWALVWLVRAQGVEKRRGEDMIRDGRD